MMPTLKVEFFVSRGQGLPLLRAGGPLTLTLCAFSLGSEPIAHGCLNQHS